MRRIIKEEEELNFFQALRAFVKGNIDTDELDSAAMSMGGGAFISTIQPSSSNLAQSEIIFDLGNDELLFELLNLSQEDQYFANLVTSYDGYSYSEIESSDSIWESFEQGYGEVYSHMDEETLEILENVSKSLVGKVLDLGDENETSFLSKMLYDLFPYQTSEIVDSYTYHLNVEISKTANESIVRELNDYLSSIGFEIYRKFDLLKTTPSNLIMWYARLGDTTLNFDELFEEIRSNSNKDLGGWDEDRYEFRDNSNFGLVSFNKKTRLKLNEILEKIKTQKNISKLKEIYSKLAELSYTVGSNWNELPGEKKYLFRIKNINDATFKLDLVITKDPYSYTSPKIEKELTLKQFENLLKDNSKLKLEEIENRKKVLLEEENEDSLFDGLRKYARGKMSGIGLEEYSDIQVIREKSLKGETVIDLIFEDDDDFFKTVCIDDDDSWFLKSVFSSYSSYEFEDSYQTIQDFKEGYNFWFELDEENVELAKRISKKILPGSDFDLQNEKFRSDLSTKLYNLFESETEGVLYDYTYLKNQEIGTTAEQEIDKELDEGLQKNGLSFSRKWDRIRTTVSNLIWLFSKQNMYNSDFKTLINSLYCDTRDRFGGWFDNQYDFRNYENFDKDTLNRDVNSYLTKILEEFEESDTFNEYIELVDSIQKKFKFDVWYDLPKLPKEYMFKIRRIDDETLKVVIELRKTKGWKVKVLGLTPEGFNRLLYQPELFGLSDIIDE